MQKNTIISAILVIIILIAGVAYWAFNRGIIYFDEGSSVPKFSQSALTNPAPSLNRTPVYPADFTAEARASYEGKVKKVTEELAKDPTHFDNWLNLAIYYRMINDHEGAVEIWEYLAELYPQDGITRHNLAEYYFHTVKDYPKAEALYEESITLSPSLESNYTDMYEMYKYVYKQDTAAAIDILKRGIPAVPETSGIQFKIMLGREYRERGDKENARTYLTQARDGAQALGNRSLSAELTAEISAL